MIIYDSITVYLIAINLFTFIVYGIDKWKAKKNLWRIPEKTLLLLAAVGGSIGAWFAMFVWRHKTKHAKFRVGIPVIIFIQLVVATYIITKGFII